MPPQAVASHRRSTQDLILEIQRLQRMLGLPGAPEDLEQQVVMLAHEVNNRLTAEKLNADLLRADLEAVG